MRRVELLNCFRWYCSAKIRFWVIFAVDFAQVSDKLVLILLHTTDKIEANIS